jgi:hypothetical protein
MKIAKLSDLKEADYDFPDAGEEIFSGLKISK